MKQRLKDQKKEQKKKINETKSFFFFGECKENRQTRSYTHQGNRIQIKSEMKMERLQLIQQKYKAKRIRGVLYNKRLQTLEETDAFLETKHLPK